ncbi:hypothetical protein COOONC_02507 [Cooperia oncophora]
MGTGSTSQLGTSSDAPTTAATTTIPHATTTVVATSSTTATAEASLKRPRIPAVLFLPTTSATSATTATTILLPTATTVPESAATMAGSSQQQPQVLTDHMTASPVEILSMQHNRTVHLHSNIAGISTQGFTGRCKKKSQFMEFNGPSKPIWTAITPTPESPGNYDHDAIFQENMKKINEMSTTTAAPVTTVKVAEIKPVKAENPVAIFFRFLLRRAEEEGENAAVTTENVFKLFEDKPTSTEAPKIEKEPVKDVVDNAAQIDVPTENVPKPAEEQKDVPTENVPKPAEEQKPEPENIFKAVEEQKPEEATADVRTDEDMEQITRRACLEGVIALTEYFEQEAQKMRGPHPKTAVVDSEVRKEDPKTEQPPAVDVPEPHFQEFQQDPRLVVD